MQCVCFRERYVCVLCEDIEEQDTFVSEKQCFLGVFFCVFVFSALVYRRKDLFYTPAGHNRIYMFFTQFLSCVSLAFDESPLFQLCLTSLFCWSLFFLTVLSLSVLCLLSSIHPSPPPPPAALSHFLNNSDVQSLCIFGCCHS